MNRHYRARIGWARIYGQWNTYDWQKVMFTDEKKISLDVPDGLRHY